MEKLLEEVEQINKITKSMFEGEHITYFEKKEKEHYDFDKNFYETGGFSSKYITELIKKTDRSKARPSNFGKGTETLYDPKVRSSKEILAEELDQELLEKIKDCIKLKTLIPDGYTYELRPYKMVFYKEGDFFSKHKDTIRDSKHIGTISCISSCSFSGGEFEIEHNGFTKSWGYTCDNYWVAIYGDIWHEVKPVTYGERISILFDIYLTGKIETFENIRLEKIEQKEINLVNFIKNKLENGYDSVIFELFHEYSKAQLESKEFKNSDSYVYNTFLKHFKVEIKNLFYYTMEYGDEIESEYILDKTGEFNNSIAYLNSYISKSAIYTNAYPYTGNDGGESENLYVRGVFQLWKN